MALVGDVSDGNFEAPLLEGCADILVGHKGPHLALGLLKTLEYGLTCGGIGSDDDDWHVKKPSGPFRKVTYATDH